MRRYGPLRDAPNPLQRVAARSLAVGALIWGVGMAPVLVMPLALAGTSVRSILLFGGSATLLAALAVYVDERIRGLTPQERGDTVVPYMPGFGGSRSDADVGSYSPPPAARPFSRLLARRTMAGSVCRGAVFGAVMALPLWPDRPIVAAGVTFIGANLGAVASWRTPRP